MVKLSWQTEKRRVSDLKLFDGNPRQMSKKQATDLMKSLKKFNLAEVPVVDQNNRILAGNMRVTALRTLGRDDETIDVRVPSRELTEDEAREYLLRSNKNTGSWDEDLLMNFDEALLLDVGWEQDFLDKTSSDKTECLEEKCEELIPYKKIHILLSFPPDTFLDVQEYLEKIIKIQGVEYEQSAN